jgi:hypothetical protein
MPYAPLARPAPHHPVGRAQQGAVSRQQLLGRGWSDHLIEAQVAARRWQIPVPGVVVTFTGPLPEATLLWIAVLHGGELAVLCHGTAARLLGVRSADDGKVHVLVPHGRKVSPAPWMVVHRSRLPQPQNAVRRPGLPPLTSPADTVLDLVDESRSWSETIGLVSMALQARAVQPRHVLGAMAARKRQRHRQLVKDVLVEVRDGATTPLEIRYRRDVERAHGLPEARRQRLDRVRRGRVWRDVDYRPYTLLVELDGRLGHSTYEDLRRDAGRDNEAATKGEMTLRYGWADVGPEAACRTAAEVAQVLNRLGWPGPLRRCPRCPGTG